MNSCYACGQLIQSDWRVCPYCSTPAKHAASTNLQQQYIQPMQTYEQQQSGFSSQAHVTQEYQSYPQQLIFTPSSNNVGKSIGVLALVGICGVALTVVLAGVLYVWASSLADESTSNYTWSGDLDSEFQDVKWYDSEGEWEKYTSSQNLEGPYLVEFSENFSKLEAQFSDSNIRLIYEAKPSSDFDDFTVDMRYGLVGDVWFVQITKVIVDGEVNYVDDGECFAQIHEDSYVNSNSWRNEVGSTNWPYWCDTVADY